MLICRLEKLFEAFSRIDILLVYCTEQKKEIKIQSCIKSIALTEKPKQYKIVDGNGKEYLLTCI